MATNVQNLSQPSDIRSTLRETDKGYYYANRLDTSGDRANMSMLRDAIGGFSKAADTLGKKYVKDQTNSALVDSAAMSDVQLQKAADNDSLSDPYRKAVRSVALHRSLIDTQGAVAKRSQELINENLPADKIQDELTKYASELMNKDGNLKNYPKDEVAETFYAPLLNSVGEQVEAYSKESARNLKIKAFDSINSTTNVSVNTVLDNKAFTHEQRTAAATASLNNMVKQLTLGGYAPDQISEAVTATVAGIATDRNDSSVLHMLDNVMFNGKPITTLTDVSNKVHTVSSNIKNEQRREYNQALDDKERADSKARDDLSMKAFKLVTDGGDAAALGRQVLKSGDWKAYRSYLLAVNTAQALKKKESGGGASNSQQQNSVMLQVQSKIINGKTFTADDLNKISMKYGLTFSQNQQLMKLISDDSGMKSALKNPLVKAGFAELNLYQIKTQNGVNMDSTGQNFRILEARNRLTQQLQGLLDQTKGEFTPEVSKQFLSLVKDAQSSVINPESDADTETDKVTGNNTQGTETAKETKALNIGTENLSVIDANLKRGCTTAALVDALVKKFPSYNREQLAELIDGRRKKQ